MQSTGWLRGLTFDVGSLEASASHRAIGDKSHMKAVGEGPDDGWKGGATVRGHERCSQRTAVSYLWLKAGPVKFKATTFSWSSLYLSLSLISIL